MKTQSDIHEASGVAELRKKRDLEKVRFVDAIFSGAIIFMLFVFADFFVRLAWFLAAKVLHHI